MFKSFPHYRQHDAMDCGPTCLQMIARYYGKRYSLQTLRERSFITREGVSMLGGTFAGKGNQRYGQGHHSGTYFAGVLLQTVKIDFFYILIKPFNRIFCFTPKFCYIFVARK